MKNNVPKRDQIMEKFQRTYPATSIDPYYQQHLPMFGSIREMSYLSKLSNSDKFMLLGTAALILAAASVGCIKDINNPSQLTGNKNAVKIAEGNISGGGHIEFYYRCPGMDGIKGDVCMIYDNEWRCGEVSIIDIGISDSKKLQDDICYKGEPKSAIIKKMLGKDYIAPV